MYHRTIKTKPIDVTSSTVFDIENNDKKDLYLKLVLLSKYQNTQNFFQMVMQQIAALRR